jgi:hypothetical protein
MDDPIADIHAVLATTAARWQALTATLPATLLRRAPGADEWPALSCLLHLLDTERYVFPSRVRAFLAGQDFPAFDPDAQGTKDTGQDPAALAAAFAELRSASLALVAKLNVSDLARTARHSELGTVTLGQMLHEWAAHDLNHTVQAERALMQPFIAACGPWRPNFADHDRS